MACRRLQHWAIFLSGFHYKVYHIKTNTNPADYLSRYPQDDTHGFDHPLLEGEDYGYINFISLSQFESVNWKNIQKETQKDTTLATVIRYCSDGWPKKDNITDELKPYYNRMNELSIDKGCLLWGYRVVIPKALENTVLNDLHSSHFGTNRMKQTARSYFWWPTIDKDIDDITGSCLICLQNRKAPEKVNLTPWPAAQQVWQRLHADFLGPLFGKMYLIIIDSYSKWPEAFLMSNITAAKTISVFKELYIRFGFPLQLVTDNGTTFTSQEFRAYCKQIGVKQSFTPPYYPATNGAAERFVQTFKSHITKIVESGHTVQYAMNLFLFDYRNTVHRATGNSPAKLIFGRDLRTRFSLMRPEPTIQNITMEMESQTLVGGGNRKVLFYEGEKVMTRDFRKGQKKWVLGKISKVLIPGITFMVEVQGREVKRHANQLLKCSQDLP